MKRLQPWLPAMGIFCLALLVRVIYNNTVAYHYYPLHDSLFYQTTGFNIIKEHCYCLHPGISATDRAPLWPFILAGISLILGPSNYFARLFLSLIGSGTCVVVYLFARDLFGWRLGLIAGIAAAIYPELYIYDGWLYTESLYTFLLFTVCYVLYRIQRNKTEKRGWRTWRMWLSCGVLLGLLSLTRPNGVIVIGLVIAWAIAMIRLKVLARRTTLIGVVTAALVACVLIAPWTVRNYLVSHSFIPVATGEGTVLLGAYNNMVFKKTTYSGGYLGTWVNPIISSPAVARSYPLTTCGPPCEVAREAAYKDAAKQWIGSHINLMPRLLELHFLNFWQPQPYEEELPMYRFPDQRSSQIVLAMMKTFPIPVFILAALGLAVTLWKGRELLFIHSVIGLTMGQALYFYGIARFRAPIEPMLILLAAGAIWWLTHREEGTLRWIIASQRNAGQTLKDETSDKEDPLPIQARLGSKQTG